jgi:hypothetical protein
MKSQERIAELKELLRRARSLLAQLRPPKRKKRPMSAPRILFFLLVLLAWAIAVFWAPACFRLRIGVSM